MSFEEYIPSPQLRPFVNCFWHYQSAGLKEVAERIIPDGCVEVIFHLKAPVKRYTTRKVAINPRMNIVGQMTAPYFVSPTGLLEMLGIRFYPHTAHHFFDIPLDEIKDEVLETSAIWGNTVEQLQDALHLAPNISEAINSLESFLVKKITIDRTDRLLAFVWNEIISKRGNLSVKELCEKTGYSRRSLEMKFQKRIGLSPKVLCRIIRFQQIFRYWSKEDSSLTALAYQVGYADQSHFIRDFKQFTGISPGKYRQEKHAISDCFTNHQSISHLFNYD
jgi:AraC-like DNA-binding protein